MQPSIGSNTVKRSLTGDDIAGVTGNYPAQNDWRWCDKCQGLFLGGNVASSPCPAGGGHALPARSGSGDCSVLHRAG